MAVPHKVIAQRGPPVSRIAGNGLLPGVVVSDHYSLRRTVDCCGVVRGQGERRNSAPFLDRMDQT